MMRLGPAAKVRGDPPGGLIRPVLVAIGLLRGTVAAAGRLKLCAEGMECHADQPEIICDPNRGLEGGLKEPTPRPPMPPGAIWGAPDGRPNPLARAPKAPRAPKPTIPPIL
jgi:hypothetical protein